MLTRTFWLEQYSQMGVRFTHEMEMAEIKHG
jgi:hypothetical protein